MKDDRQSGSHQHIVISAIFSRHQPAKCRHSSTITEAFNSPVCVSINLLLALSTVCHFIEKFLIPVLIPDVVQDVKTKITMAVDRNCTIFSVVHNIHIG